MVAESPGAPGDMVDENSLKRRMLGAVVLIALAVIFLPLVFDGSGTESQFRSIEPLQMEPPYDAVILNESTMSLADGTPVIDFVEDDQLTQAEVNEVALQASRPQEDAVEIEVARPVAAVAEPITNPVVVAKTNATPLAAPPVQPTVVEAPVVAPVAAVDNGSWLIQIASFKDKINALGLRSDLKKDGHPVLVKVGDLNGENIFRVFVGPIIGRDDATQVKSTLEQSLNRETLLVEDK